MNSMQNSLQTLNRSSQPTTRNSRESLTTTSATSNLGVEIGNLLDRFYLEQGWNIKRTEPDQIAEHKQTIKFWIEHLAAANVPVDAFQTVYRKVIQLRADAKRQQQYVSAKLTPDDFLAAWYLVKEERERKQAEERAEAQKINKPLLCKKIGEHFSGEFNGGFVDRSEGLRAFAIGGQHEKVELVPCQHCRPEAYAQFVNRRKARPVNALELMNDQKPPETDPTEIIAVCIDALGKEASAGNGQSHQAWLKMIRVATYVRGNK